MKNINNFNFLHKEEGKVEKKRSEYQDTAGLRKMDYPSLGTLSGNLEYRYRQMESPRRGHKDYYKKRRDYPHQNRNQNYSRCELYTETRVIKFSHQRSFRNLRNERNPQKQIKDHERNDFKDFKKVDKESVVHLLEKSLMFRKGKYLELEKFVLPADSITLNKREGRNNTTKDIAEEEKNHKENELKNEYGVGYDILKQLGFNYGMGLGRNEQGDPVIIDFKNITSLGSDPDYEQRKWICEHCNLINENLRLSCLKCNTNRSFYEESSKVDY